MRYKIVVKAYGKTFVKDMSKSKEHLIRKAEIMSKKHRKWKIYVVAEDVMV